MAIERDMTECPFCGYENAYIEYDYGRGEDYVQCPRCGYTHTYRWHKGKNSKEGGRGCYLVRKKQETKFDMGPISKETLKSMKEQLEKVEECKYTYLRKGQWYIKDLITNEILLFSAENLGIIDSTGRKLEKDMDEFIKAYYVDGKIRIATDEPNVGEDELFRLYCHDSNCFDIFSEKLKAAQEKDGQ